MKLYIVGSVLFYTRKWSEEAPEMGEFVDIHNINSENPHDYDILIQDVLGNELSEIADVSLSGPQKKMRTRLSHAAKGSSMVEIIDSCSRAYRNIETSPGGFSSWQILAHLAHTSV